MPRSSQVENTDNDNYDQETMELEIQRVSRELYKAFAGLNAGFEDAKDQIVIDELSTHTDVGRQEAIHPYKVTEYNETMKTYGLEVAVKY